MARAERPVDRRLAAARSASDVPGCGIDRAGDAYVAFEIEQRRSTILDDVPPTGHAVTDIPRGALHAFALGSAAREDWLGVQVTVVTSFERSVSNHGNSRLTGPRGDRTGG